MALTASGSATAAAPSREDRARSFRLARPVSRLVSFGPPVALSPVPSVPAKGFDAKLVASGAAAPFSFPALFAARAFAALSAGASEVVYFGSPAAV
jgi:hypothetical protein